MMYREEKRNITPPRLQKHQKSGNQQLSELWLWTAQEKAP